MITSPRWRTSETSSSLCRNKIAACVDSQHLQVTDKALTFFEKDSFLNKVREYSNVTYPILIPSIEKQLKEHWHDTLKISFKDLKSILKELDKQTYETVLKTYKEQVEEKVTKRQELDSKWKVLEDRIKASQPDYTPPVLPFDPSCILSDFYDLYPSI